jgi:hypothetical protein
MRGPTNGAHLASPDVTQDESRSRPAARLPVEVWLTYRELGVLFMLNHRTIRNTMWRFRLPRAYILVGREHRRHAIVPPETARALARLLGRPA